MRSTGMLNVRARVVVTNSREETYVRSVKVEKDYFVSLEKSEETVAKVRELNPDIEIAATLTFHL